MISKSFRNTLLFVGFILILIYGSKMPGSLKDKPVSTVGGIARTFELPGVYSHSPSFKMAEHLGQKVIILNFFATWCGPCRMEMPDFERFHLAHKDSGQVILVAINVGEKSDTVARFVEQLRLTMPVVLDESETISSMFAVRGLPTTVVIGKDETVRLHRVGMIPDPEKTFAQFL